MRSKSAIGALHPILFFVVMYVVVLFLSIFICSSLFYSFNGRPSDDNTAQMADKQSFPIAVSTAVVVR